MIIREGKTTYLFDEDFVYLRMPDSVEKVEIYQFKYPLKESFNRSDVVIYSGKLGRKLIKSKY